MKFGCCVSIQNIDKAKNFGYDFVELSALEIMQIEDKDWSETRDYILSQEIPIIGFNAFCDASHPIIGPQVDTLKLMEYLDTVIHRAADLRCSSIGIGSPSARIIPLFFAHIEAQLQMKGFLTEAAIRAAKYDINILYEAINPHDCNFGNSTLEIYELVKELDLPNLRIVWDVYHAVNSNEDFETLRDVFQLIDHVHICSWDAKKNRAFLLSKDQKYIEKLINFLKSVNYSRTISIEAPDSNFIVDGMNSLELYKTTRQLLIY